MSVEPREAFRFRVVMQPNRFDVEVWCATCDKWLEIRKWSTDARCPHLSVKFRDRFSRNVGWSPETCWDFQVDELETRGEKK